MNRQIAACCGLLRLVAAGLKGKGEGGGRGVWEGGRGVVGVWALTLMPLTLQLVAAVMGSFAMSRSKQQ